VIKAEGKALVLTIDDDDGNEGVILCNGSKSSEHEDGVGAQVP
jgi:hypothetical protein